MIYRVDWQRFLTHMIDHFSYDELTHFEWVIISARILFTNKSLHIQKIPELYPDVNMVETYEETKSKEALEQGYYELLRLPKNKKFKEYSYGGGLLYSLFVKPMIQHKDVVIICNNSENDYIDCICKILKDFFALEVIDLNELFTKGRIGPIYIDRDEIWDRAVDIRRGAAVEDFKSKKSTLDGRRELIEKISKKQKIDELKRLGYKVTKEDEKHLDKLLMEAWDEE